MTSEVTAHATDLSPSSYPVPTPSTSSSPDVSIRTAAVVLTTIGFDTEGLVEVGGVFLQ
ncbi:hypothetical protein [Streptomyces pseudovenezuelae]|uniref:Uncharacterized protein n=1 Tax=Streptomyces pseudovenezuelae TaxID=67350 RepID=A0ABT6M3R6_9ACTN|nr:hypothetical protein [Streptomyces pseudovenezuelae]MDH6222641.1 hypothetical protein [Streptomyces pseudovenezuelae]